MQAIAYQWDQHAREDHGGKQATKNAVKTVTRMLGILSDQWIGMMNIGGIDKNGKTYPDQQDREKRHQEHGNDGAKIENLCAPLL